MKRVRCVGSVLSVLGLCGCTLHIDTLVVYAAKVETKAEAGSGKSEVSAAATQPAADESYEVLRGAIGHAEK